MHHITHRQHHGEGEAEALHADLAGELAEDVGEVDADAEDDGRVDGHRRLRPHLDGLAQKVLVRPDVARVLHLRDVDPVADEGRLGLGEDHGHLLPVEPQAEMVYLCFRLLITF